MSIFRFKQFELQQRDAAMKVGTDSVLLGCLTPHRSPARILDIGTGTGLLALMMAQRFADARIDAVELDRMAAAEARGNMENAPWSDRLQLFEGSIADFVSEEPYDLIISNPPYFSAGNQTPIDDPQRSKARHNDTLPPDMFMQHVSALLHATGICSLILPVFETEVWLEAMQPYGLYLQQQVQLIPKEGKSANRIISVIGKQQVEPTVSTFMIYRANGTYSLPYVEATFPFLLWEGLASPEGYR